MTKEDPISLGNLLDGQALPRTLADRLPSQKLLAAWREIAGPMLASRAMPISLDAKGVITVAVAGSAWRQEVRLAAPELVEALTRRGFAVSTLREVPAKTPPRPKPELPLPELTSQEERELEDLVTTRDPELARALRSLLKAQARAKKRLRQENGE